MSYASYYGRLARQSGYSIAKGIALPFVRREAVRSGAHEMAYPISTYAPWQADAEFRARLRRGPAQHARRRLALLRAVEPRRRAARRPRRDPRGRRLARRHGRAHGGKRGRALGIDDPVYLCDTWEGVVKTGDGRHLLPRRQARRHVARDRRSSSSTELGLRQRRAAAGHLSRRHRRADRRPTRSGSATATSTSTSPRRTSSTGSGRGSRPAASSSSTTTASRPARASRSSSTSSAMQRRPPRPPQPQRPWPRRQALTPHEPRPTSLRPATARRPPSTASASGSSGVAVRQHARLHRTRASATSAAASTRASRARSSTSCASRAARRRRARRRPEAPSRR